MTGNPRSRGQPTRSGSLPVTGHAIPQHARVASGFEFLHHRGMEQMRAHPAASSIGPKEALRLSQPRQSLLGAFELIERGLPIEFDREECCE